MGFRSLAKDLTIVDLPQPFAPIRIVILFIGNSIETPSIITVFS